jgi:hypothetical protein
MRSTLTWLDYSERDRRRALDVVDLFKETGTVDELGLGAIRDGFSDLFFPGTSTIQTRACYFLLLPWTFLRMERKRIPSNKATEWARTEELRINDRLLQGEDSAGVFGKSAGWNLKRLPSDAYWGGLGSWGIRLFPGYGYFRSLDRFYRDLDAAKSMPYDPEGRKPVPANWHPHRPDPPHGFPYQGVTTALRRKDAVYLRDRIQARHPGSLLAVLVGRADEEDLEADWPWELAGRTGVAPVLREQLGHARRFAVALHGAALLYNLMLAELRRDDELIRPYRKDLEKWAVDIDALRAEIADWKLNDVWAVVRTQGRSLGLPTQAFVERWLHGVRERGPRAVFADGAPERALVRDREVRLKGPRARLASQRHLELWGGGSGTGRLDYRWTGTRVILRDIFAGLARSGGDAGDA